MMARSPEYIFERLPQWFCPERAGSRKLTVVYEIVSGLCTDCFTVRIENGKLSCTAGDSALSDTRVRIARENYPLLLDGTAAPLFLGAFSGILRYFGNTLGHDELLSYLRLPDELAAV